MSMETKNGCSKQQLKEIGIFDWPELAPNFKDSNLLLGNGFSLNIAQESFKYDSIFEEFLGNCPTDYGNIFKIFGTSNFESILQKLCDTKYVNELFGIREPRVDQAIQLLQNGLITTIRDIHPKAEEIYWDKLERLANQVRFFSDIFTLNYDLFLYHIVMILKDQMEKNEKYRGTKEYKRLWRYSDCFWKNYDGDFHLFSSYQDIERFRFVYYLHGALFIFRKSLDDLKLLRRSNEVELINLIRGVIQGGRMPLFVCEGSSESKLEQINSSNYLRFARRKLKYSGEKFVIFGSSMAEQDNHIFNELDQSKNHLSISIHIGTKSCEELTKIKERINNKFINAAILFFDSETLFKL